MNETITPVARPDLGSEEQESRSAATREKLLGAAYQILSESRHAGLRSANVSTLSGVSRGGLLHHFPTKEDLVAATYERIVLQMERASWERIETAPDDGLLEAIVEDARARFFSDSYKVMLDILVASAKEKPLADTRKALAERLQPTTRQGWAQRLAATGISADMARHVTVFLWNMVRGLAVRAVVEGNEELSGRVIALGLQLAQRRCDASRVADR